MESARSHVSIVLPVYYNEQSLQGMLASLQDKVICVDPARSYEVIFVDDGSGDGSLAVLHRLRKEHPQLVRVIKLTRNFGQVSAIRCGLEHARGDYVVVLSADGQDPPELINEMLQCHSQGYQIVVCTREGRDEAYHRVITSRIFYWLMQKLTFPHMPPGGFDFLSLSREALTILLRNRESHAFLQGQVLWIGYQPKFIPYRRGCRKGGESRWTFAKKLTYLLDGILSYSYVPLRLMSLLGIICAFVGFAYAMLIVVLKIFGGIPIQGWAPLMMVILVIGGIQMLMTGIVGEYLWRTLAQVRNRDPYVIEAVFE